MKKSPKRQKEGVAGCWEEPSERRQLSVLSFKSSSYAAGKKILAFSFCRLLSLGQQAGYASLALSFALHKVICKQTTNPFITP